MKRVGGLKNEKGFTLVEIIVVLVILAILAAASIPAMIGFVNEARGKAYVAEARVGLSAAQAVVTELVASGVATVGTSGEIDWDDTDAAAAVGNPDYIYEHPTFAGMCQDVKGATYAPPTGSTVASLTANPFTSVTVSDSGDSRVTGITYVSDLTPGNEAFQVVIAGGTTTVSKITNGTSTPAGS